MEENKNIFTDTILIALLTLLGYLSSFYYEYGYLSFFGISNQLIEISLTNVFIAITATFFIVYISFMLIDLFYQLGLFKRNTAIARAMTLPAIYIVYMLIMLIIYRGHWANWGILVTLAGIMIFFGFVWPILFQRRKGSLEEKLLAQEQLESDVSKNGLFDQILTRFGKSLFQYLLFSLGILFVAFNLGKSEALNQETYMLLDEDLAVVRIYSQNVIAIKVDKEKKRIADSIQIFSKTNFDERVEFRKETIGPLIEKE